MAGVLNSPLGSCPVGAGVIVGFLLHLSLRVREISDSCSSTECAYLLSLEYWVNFVLFVVPSCLTLNILHVGGVTVHILVYLLWLVWTFEIFLTKPQRTQHSARSSWQPVELATEKDK